MAICRNCGTEIADKAIVCYRCGTSTAEPVRRPAEVRPRGGRLLPLAALVLLVLAALFLGRAGQTTIPEPYRLPAEVALGAAMVVAVLRMIRRK
jgi:peptidoglycan/LPS O-acetylase OafA/YrhL